jgi:hypothetical protein
VIGANVDVSKRDLASVGSALLIPEHVQQFVPFDQFGLTGARFPEFSPRNLSFNKLSR